MFTLSQSSMGYRSSGSTLGPASLGFRHRQSIINRDAALPYDFRRLIDIDKLLSVYSSRGFTSSHQIPFDFMNVNNLIIRSVILPLAFMAEIESDAVIPVDFNLNILTDSASVIDIRKELALDKSIVYELLKTLAADKVLPVAYNRDFVRSAVIPISFRESIYNDVLQIIDIRKELSAVTVLPLSFIKSFIRNADIPISFEGGRGNVVFMHPAGAVHFYKDPLKGQQQGLKMFQPSGRDSDGEFYSATKSTIRIRDEAVAFRHVSDVTIERLRYFIEQAARGVMNQFTYWDVDNNAYTAKFKTPDFDWQKDDTNKNNIVIYLEIYL